MWGPGFAGLVGDFRCFPGRYRGLAFNAVFYPQKAGDWPSGCLTCHKSKIITFSARRQELSILASTCPRIWPQIPGKDSVLARISLQTKKKEKRGWQLQLSATLTSLS